MATIYEDLIPTLIENTTMQRSMVDGVQTAYTITPNEGYLLHDKLLDAPVYDEWGFETGEIALGFRRHTAACSVNYDFKVNPREFYAAKKD